MQHGQFNSHTTTFLRSLLLKPSYVAVAALIGSSAVMANSPAALELYVDRDTKQVFTEPGPNRDRLGRFQAATAADAADTKVTADRKGLTVKSADGDFTVSLGGRIHMDATSHTNDDLQFRSGGAPTEAVSGTDIRRARIALKGVVYRDFSYVIEADWAGDNVSMKDLLVVYHPSSNMEITVGNQKHAMSMEIQESSNDIMFNERSLVSALTTPYFDRAIGVNLKAMGTDWSLQGGVYGDAMSSSGDGADEGGGWGLRGTIAPLNQAGEVVHLGFGLGQRRTNDNNTLVNSKTPRFRYETTAMSDLYLSNTGTLAGFEGVDLAMLEFAAMHGPLSLQAEYAQATVTRDGGEDLDFSGYYVQAGWTLTGEARTYKGSDGEFKMLKPAQNFDPNRGQWGAWELALRLDELDLNDQDISGGREKRVSLNLNWYLNSNLRVLFGYSRAYDVVDGPVLSADGSDPDDIDVFAIRGQLAL